MRLQELLAPLLIKHVIGADTGEWEDLQIESLTADSRQVKPGCLFIALRGYTVDGHRFVSQAVEAGASAVLVEAHIEGLAAPQVVVPNTRAALAVLASVFYRHPTQQMKVIGVTGTNGKTTITNLIDRILTDAGHKTGLIGTIQTRIGDRVLDSTHTTPDVIELQDIFRQMLDIETEYPIMEVSSHALDQKRVAGTAYHTAIFTNLTQDHLDYHGTMDAYRDAKLKLFSRLGNTYQNELGENHFAVINADDPAAADFISATTAQVITYGIDNAADLRATDVQIAASGVSYRLTCFAGTAAFHLQMTGKFSVYNALAATAAALAEGISLEQIKRSLEAVGGVDGRFERVQAGQDFTVIVDYSHTPDSLENALKTIREFATGRVFCLIGCGGDRDRTKRPIMARIAAEYADLAVITSDNPRTEDPERILDDMEAGLTEVAADRYVRIADRAAAIRYCVEHATTNDVVLLAGKGHETYQIIGKTYYDFDDREVAAKAIRREI